jgi:hypothetical protein
VCLAPPVCDATLRTTYNSNNSIQISNSCASFGSCFNTIEDACTLQFRDLSLACQQALRVPSYTPIAGDSCLFIDDALRRHLDALALLLAVAVKLFD